MTELKIAIRYIFSKHSYNFITIINLLSLIGITIGVASLIIVISIFNAFQNIAVEQIVGFDPHIKIIKPESGSDNYSKLIRDLRSLPEVEDLAEIAESRIICFKGSTSKTSIMNTLNQKDLHYFSNFDSRTIVGNSNLNFRSNSNEILIGAGIADAFSVLAGDTLFMTTAQEIETSILMNSLPRTIPVVVSGIFQTNVKDYDYNFIIGLDALSDELFSDLPSQSEFISIRLDDIASLENAIKEIEKLIGETDNNLKLVSWKDLNKEYYNVMKFEKMATTFILGLIILVAIFNVFASLTMTIIEKKKDISVMRAIGGTKKFISRIYFYEGLFVGIIGSVTGGVLGILLCLGQIQFKWFKIDSSKYIMDSIPILLYPIDVLLIVLFSIVLAVLATIYPVRKSASIDIVESLREE